MGQSFVHTVTTTWLYHIFLEMYTYCLIPRKSFEMFIGVNSLKQNLT